MEEDTGLENTAGSAEVEVEPTLRDRLNKVSGKTFLLRNFKQGGSELAAYNQQSIIAEALILVVENQGEIISLLTPSSGNLIKKKSKK